MAAGEVAGAADSPERPDPWPAYLELVPAHPGPAPADPDGVRVETRSTPAAVAVADPPPPSESAPAKAPDVDPPVVDPQVPRRRRGPGWAKTCVALGITLAVLAGAAVTAIQLLAHRYEGSVHKDLLIAPEARRPAAGATLRGPLNYLLVGSDARADDPEGGQRSDSIIVVHIPAGLDRAYLLSVPRDLLVDIPPYQPTNFAGSREKINASFEYGNGGSGGVQLLSSTLTKLTGIQFDGAAVINFQGFQKAVELLGGVYLCVDVRTESQHIGYDSEGNFRPPWIGPEGSIRDPESTPKVYEPGCRHMVAWEALDYVRQRKSLPGGDFDRQHHQQQFLKAILDEARQQGVASNPGKIDDLIRAIGSSFTVDTGGVSLSDLVFALRDIQPSSMVGIRLPSETATIDGTSYVVADERSSEALYTALRTDSLDVWAERNTEWINPL